MPVYAYLWRISISLSTRACFLFRTLGWASFQDGLLFEISFANSSGGLLLEIKPTGLLFVILRYIEKFHSSRFGGRFAYFHFFYIFFFV